MKNASKPTPDHAVFPARIRRLRGLLKQQDLDYLLVTNPLDVAYLTSFTGGDSYLLIAPDSCTLVSDFRYQEELEEVKEFADIVIRRGTMGAALADLFASMKIEICGVQAETMSLAEHAGLLKLVKRGGARKLLPTSGLLASMRTIKDAREVSLIRHAVKIQEKALEAVLLTITSGMSELEIAAAIEAGMKERGSSAPGFQTIVAAQPNGSLPHYRPGPAKVKKNQTVLIDWGAIYCGYHGDMTRVFALGKWPAKIAEIYKIVLDAHELAAAAIKPGKTTREIDAVARDHIDKHGYLEQFGHGLGHGLGFNGHEEPRLTNMAAPTVLQAGQVVTIEPGIYLPGVGGVRIEDDYVITDKGAVNLCSMPRSMDWCTLKL